MSQLQEEIPDELLHQPELWKDEIIQWDQENSPVCKCLAAYWTDERPFTSVQSHVTLENP
ncbi:hypothetical protein J437_LFUL013864 [Ladona fulva]|uniref:Uncharacterized protein n=1 Tax=Ladona fulva TaxID=123851 RepID=A0A8K0KGU8_LADFU|nr:hypothetical protein J437_LFUL013864 [Ladona fulva]